MNRMVFLLEEPSMKALLDGLLPRLFPHLVFQCVPHDGKADLEKSIPRKLRVWRDPGIRFVIVRDNDRGDCLALKQRLENLCSVRPQRDVMIRIVCQELEAWYLAEPDALADAFEMESLRGIGGRRGFGQPDAVSYPVRELARLVPRFQKVSGARLLAGQLTRRRNRSPSFHAMIDGIEQLASRDDFPHNPE